MERKSYLRDGRAPVPADPRTSAVMSRIKGRDTGPERALRALLSANGVRGYRLNYAKAPGRPDIAFVGKRIAVFVHGCFWHGCPHCRPKRPSTNRSFWDLKLDRNVARDKRKVRALRNAGWRVCTIWECRLRTRPERELGRVLAMLGTD